MSRRRTAKIDLLKLLPSPGRRSAVRVLIPKSLLQKTYGDSLALDLEDVDAVILARFLDTLAVLAVPGTFNISVKSVKEYP